MQIPSLEEMLAAGVHFGHKTSRWHPNMAPYIFCERGGVHVINLELTQKQLESVLETVKQMAADGKTILFVGTKKQTQAIVVKHALDCGMPYVTERWLGGTLTNFSEIFKRIKKYLSLKDQQAKGELAKYTKKEQMEFAEEIVALEHILGGVSTLTRLPDVLFVTDMRREKTALTEAIRKNIPVVGICDTNANPGRATYIIPANDDAVNSIEMMVALVAGAVKEGRALWKEKQAAMPAPVAPVKKVMKAPEAKETSE